MTRPEAVRADTFDLQSNANINGPLSTRNADLGFEGLGDEEEDIYDDDNEDEDDDGDALSSSPSIPDDDIDFDFMYALHSFAATVEGQANATKGDMLVLLDDSNSYWWLVRIVKDHTVGYLPAETIETPQERLARLNKHRNIDLTAIMLEDHSPTSRSSSRKPFRRKGAKTVVFNNSCTYYQLDSLHSDSEGEDEEDYTEDYITEIQLDDSDEHNSEHGHQSKEERTTALQQRRANLAELDELIDNEDHPSPRIGIETLDVSDYGGRKIMRIKDLNEQVGERPTSAIFRDSKLEPLKISVTPSIARDRTSVSPTEEPLEMIPVAKLKWGDRERDLDRTRSLSVSSVNESVGDLDPREKDKDKKGRKNSVFGNLFKKRTKKLSKDEETREFDLADTKATVADTSTNRAGTIGDEDSLRKDWTRPGPPQNDDANSRNEVSHKAAKHLNRDKSKEQDVSTRTLELSPDLSPEGHLSPAPTNGSSSLLTPSLPWFDASLHSFLDNDTSIRDVLVLVHEGSRLRKRSSANPINPQIADLYSACAIHIEEMSSHLDDVLMSYLFDLKT